MKYYYLITEEIFILLKTFMNFIQIRLISQICVFFIESLGKQLCTKKMKGIFIADNQSMETLTSSMEH